MTFNLIAGWTKMDRKWTSLSVASCFMGLNMKVPGPTRPAGKESISCIKPSAERCPEMMESSLKLISVTFSSIDCSTFITCSPVDVELLTLHARSVIAHPATSQEASCIVHFEVAKRRDAREPLLA